MRSASALLASRPPPQRLPCTCCPTRHARRTTLAKPTAHSAIIAVPGHLRGCAGRAILLSVHKNTVTHTYRTLKTAAAAEPTPIAGMSSATAAPPGGPTTSPPPPWTAISVFVEPGGPQSQLTLQPRQALSGTASAPVETLSINLDMGKVRSGLKGEVKWCCGMTQRSGMCAGLIGTLLPC
jgi:hypothetical protein